MNTYELSTSVNELGDWLTDPDPASLNAYPHPDYGSRNHCHTVQLGTLSGDAVKSPKLLDGHKARLWGKNSPPLEWVGSDGPGPSNVEMLEIRRLHLRAGGIVLHNANGARIQAEVVNSPVGLKALNRNSGGQSEQNVADVRVANCDVGVALGSGTGNPSHRWWDLRALITGTDKPFSVGEGCNVYGGLFRLVISAKSGVSNAQMCLDGYIHGARFEAVIENACDIGIALGNPTKPGWTNPGNQQGFIRAHFVHAVQNPGIFDGPMAELPPYRFTYGNGHNQNHTRPAWQCADGDVFDTYRPPT